MTSDDTARDLALRALMKLERYAHDGLPSCYKSADDMLCDFYADLPWNAANEVSIRWLLAPEQRDRVEAAGKALSFDFVAEFTSALVTMCKAHS